MVTGSWLKSFRQKFQRFTNYLTRKHGSIARRKRRRLAVQNIEGLEERTLLSTFFVTNSNDSGTGSLRQAILNANDNPGKDRIEFSFSSPVFQKVITPGTLAIDLGEGATQTLGLPNEVVVIRPTSARLPTIREAVVIDGTLPGFGLVGQVPGVEIRGDVVGDRNSGLFFDNADGSEVYGLIINSFERGINLVRSDNVSIADCYLGVTVPGTGTTGNTTGVNIVTGSANNDIRNCYFVGNTFYGIFMTDEFTTGNVVAGNVFADNNYAIQIRNAEGNQIGLEVPTLGNSFRNNQVGVSITRVFDESTGVSRFNRVVNNLIDFNTIGISITDTKNNTIGGSGALSANTIIRNTEGIVIEGSNATNNRVEGNYIGIFKDGRATTSLGQATGNGAAGIRIWDAADNTVTGNTISGNNPDKRPDYAFDGAYVGQYVPSAVVIGSIQATGNLIVNNRIGTNPAGTASVPNYGAGIRIQDTSLNTIRRNIISSSLSYEGSIGPISYSEMGIGLSIEGQSAVRNVVEGNKIGTNAAGTASLPNDEFGILILDSRENVIGGTTSAASNLISGNRGDGVYIAGPNASANQVLGNLIGTNLAGTAALANKGSGVVIDNAPGNKVGGPGIDDGNVISGNGQSGVLIYGAGAAGTIVQSNRIGVDKIGITPIGNKDWGVLIVESSNNQIGGTSTYAGNYIGGNGDGVGIIGTEVQNGADASNNTIQGNGIGVVALGLPAGNSGAGVYLSHARGNTIGGTTAAASNLIGANGSDGLVLDGRYSRLNQIQGNRIGDNRPNGASGIAIIDGSDNVIGGTSAGAANVIRGNNADGIFVNGSFATGNTITRNVISNNSENGISLAGGSATRIGGDRNSNLGNTIEGNDRAGIAIGASSTIVSGNTLQYNTVGIVVFAGSNSLIGGATQSLGNIIRSNSGPGVLVFNTSGHAILSNQIVENRGLGIDLVKTPAGTLLSGGVTPNDANDIDDGGNHFQNFPVLTSVTTNLNSTTINGTINSTPNTTITIQFFSSAFGDSSGFGEGETLIGQANVTTNASGNATINSTFSVVVSPGFGVSATATTVIGGVARDTSEFSENIRLPTVEDQVNFYHLGDQFLSSVASDAAGNYVVAWYGWNGVGNVTPNAVLYRRFDAGGVPLDNQDYVAADESGFMRDVKVAMDPDGDFVITWATDDVYAMRFDSEGVPLDANPFQVNTLTEKQQFAPSISMDADGDFVIAWTSGYYFGNYGDGDTYGVYARRYNAAGVPQNAQEFLVNTTIAGHQEMPSVAMNGDGSFIIAWSQRPSSGAEADLIAQRYDIAGQRIGSEFQLNPATQDVTGYDGPSIAMNSSGGFVAVWKDSFGPIYARRFSSTGQPLDAQSIRISSNTSGFNGTLDEHHLPSVDMDDSGAFIVTWERERRLAANTYDMNIVARRYNSSGQAQGTEFLVHDFTAGGQRDTSIAVAPNGLNYVVVWVSGGQDGDGDGIFSRTFGPTNAPPSAVGQSVVVPAGQQLQITLQGDDGNSEVNQTLTFYIVSSPSHGTLTGFNPTTGIVTYLPEAGFAGDDSFQFSVTDDRSAGGNALTSVPVLVKIEVNAVPVQAGRSFVAFVANGAALAINSALTLTDGNDTTLVGATVTIDDYVANEDQLGFTNDGQTMGNIAVASNQGGVLALTSAGSNATLGQWQSALRAVTYANSNSTPTGGDRSVTFAVNDGGNVSEGLASVITLKQVNQPPVLAVTQTSLFVENGNAIPVNPLLTVTDSDNPNLTSATVSLTNNFNAEDILSFTNNPATMGNIEVQSHNNGVLSLVSPGGTATVEQWQFALRSVTYLNVSQHPTATARTIAFVVNDGLIASNSVSATVNISALNDPPILTTSGQIEFTENGPLVPVQADLQLTDSDNPTLASATVTLVGFVAGQDELVFANQGSEMGNISIASNTGGVLTLTSNGATATVGQWEAALRGVYYRNTSNNPAVQIRTVSTVVSDGSLTSTALVSTIQVVAVNDAPVALDGALTAILNQAAQGTLPFSDIDSNTSTLTASIDTGAGHGLVEILDSHAGTYRYTPSNGYLGADFFTFHFTDGSLLSETKTIQITVLMANNPPSITSPNTTTTAENLTNVMTLTATDTDVPTQAINFTLTGGADETLFTLSPAGVLVFKSGPNFEAPADSDQNNVYVIQVSASDGAGGTATQTLSITVTNVNEAPVATNGTLSVAQLAATGTLVVSDVDSTPAQLTISIVNTPSHGTVQILDVQTGAYRYTPSPGYSGDDSFTFQASDGQSLSNTATVTLDVTNTNQPPVFTSAATVSVQENSTTVLTVRATDPDLPAQTVTFTLTGGADPALFTISTAGVLRFKTAPDFEDPTDADEDNVYEVQITADDGQGGLTTQNLEITVTNVVTTPVVFIKKQAPVAIFPTATVTGETQWHGGSLVLSMNAIGRKKSVDLLTLPSTAALGTSSGVQFANGRLRVEIQFNQTVTGAQIQTFIRGLRFSTKGAGFQTTTRNFTATFTSGSGTVTTLPKTINVRKK